MSGEVMDWVKLKIFDKIFISNYCFSNNEVVDLGFIYRGWVQNRHKIDNVSTSTRTWAIWTPTETLTGLCLSGPKQAAKNDFFRVWCMMMTMIITLMIKFLMSHKKCLVIIARFAIAIISILYWYILCLFIFFFIEEPSSTPGLPRA